MIINAEGSPRDGSAPQDFVERVRQVLEHLYDFPYLQSHPLTQQAESNWERVGEAAGQHVRRQVISAIETLGPGQGAPFRAPHARLYNLLHLHYIEGMTVEETARDLSISTRQAYRDLIRGVEGVAAVLWGHYGLSASREAEDTQLAMVQAEIERLETHPRRIDIRALLQQALDTVEELALRRNISFHVDVPPHPVLVPADPVVARQIVISTVSHTIQQAQPGTFQISVLADDVQVSLSLSYGLDPEAQDVSVADSVVTQLADRQGWKFYQEDQQGGGRTVVICFPSQNPTVLVIDDNEGLVELLARYLTNHPCRVTAAASGREGLQLMQELRPDAIVLDVMMPETDGWQVLQMLRARPETADIPVIMCSVLTDPELAHSLGASAFLSKPVSRDDMLTALRDLGVV